MHDGEKLTICHEEGNKGVLEIVGRLLYQQDGLIKSM
jgi:hypothetical protein